MITCRQLVELLIDYVSGELPPEHQERIQQHLRDCPPCEVYVSTYRLTIQLTRKLPCQPLPTHLAERLREALEAIRKEQASGGPSGGGRS